MKGNNIIKLNEATVIEAVQEYLDKRVHDDFRQRVNAVVPEDQGHVTVFRVEVSEIELGS